MLGIIKTLTVRRTSVRLYSFYNAHDLCQYSIYRQIHRIPNVTYIVKSIVHAYSNLGPFANKSHYVFASVPRHTGIASTSFTVRTNMPTILVYFIKRLVQFKFPSKYVSVRKNITDVIRIINVGFCERIVRTLYG